MTHDASATQHRPGRRRVLVVIRWPVGGIRTWCRYVYRDQAFSSYNITVVLPDDPEAHTLKHDLADTDINVIIPQEVETTLGFAKSVWGTLLRGQFDLVHSHGFTSALIVSLACQLRNVRHLTTAHDVILDDQYSDFRGRMTRRAIAWALRSADCVQAVGYSAADNLRAALPRARSGRSDYLVVRNGIDSSRYLNATPRDIRANLSVSGDTILVGFFGRFMGQKGFRYLVDAVRIHEAGRVADSRPIVVIAVGGGGFRREEEQSISQLGLMKCFRFLDFEPDIAGLMKAVDVVAMPSLWEACSLLHMEALAAGVPIVVSDWSSCVEIATDTPSKVVPRKNSAKLLEAILEMSSAQSKARARDFQTVAASRFDISRTIVAVSNLYERMLAE